MDRILIIGRGKMGWHADGMSNSGNRCSSSGGSLDSYLTQAQDGTWIYDAEDANHCAFATWVISGPMLDPRLDPHEIDHFNSGDKKTLLGLLPGLGGDFRKLGVMALSDLSSFDFVGLDVYLAGLREIPGIKIGRVYNHQVEWE